MTTKRADDFGLWYSEVVVESEMISYYDVSGAHSARALHEEARSQADVEIPNALI